MGFLPPLFLQEHSGEEMDTQGENWTKREGLEHTGRELGTQGGSGTPRRAEPPALLGTTSFDPASLRPSQLPGRAVRGQNYLSVL